MAVSISSFTSIFLSNPHPLPLLSVTPKCQYPLRLVLCSSGKDGVLRDRRKQILEEYGLNPSDYVSDPSEITPKAPRRKKGRENPPPKGARVAPEEHKIPRTTHKLLQVLGGKARRRKLLSPKGMDVRPMMEVVRGAAFDILQVAGGCPASLRPGRWLDLYSGTGSVGIEAISRGCSEVHFIEMDPWVVSEVLRPNLECTGFLDVSVIHTIRVENFLGQAEQFPGKFGTFDYISVTPPYTEVNYSVLMDQLSRSPLVGKDTFILVEYPLRTVMLESCGSLVKVSDRRFGRTHLAIYGPPWSQKKRKSEELYISSLESQLQASSLG
ncbi:uncharacterized protein LOC18429306 isoform X2 [Amborella trichopoda]|uniref:uncharacterized protein LOC18429306 isoform X2 n=1 Tax=Amborella trichopoda TaxID=13333 RepID=UPI0009BD0541|nr:uncharacterized protein LOC18429306 isoform X2 [Amborella trichopoda]|eukprot:XP_020519777.1 uncharacterized protein LOC18429306 isoform X2 [Amborella trichopoda]